LLQLSVTVINSARVRTSCVLGNGSPVACIISLSVDTVAVSPVAFTGGETRRQNGQVSTFSSRSRVSVREERRRPAPAKENFRDRRSPDTVAKTPAPLAR